MCRPASKHEDDGVDTLLAEDAQLHVEDQVEKPKRNSNSLNGELSEDDNRCFQACSLCSV